MNPLGRTQYPQSQLPLCLHPHNTYSQRVTCLSSREEVHVARAGARYLLPRKRVSVEHGCAESEGQPSLYSAPVAVRARLGRHIDKVAHHRA